MDTYEALVLAGRVSELSIATTPEQDAIVPVLVTPSKVAEPWDANICEEEDTAILVTVARMVTRHTLADEPKPLVVGDLLSDKDIIAWLHNKLHQYEVGEPRAWTMAVTYMVSCLNIMRKYEGSKGTGHTTDGLAWRRCHIFVVNSDDNKGLYWLCLCHGLQIASMGLQSPHLGATSLSFLGPANVETPQVKGCFHTSSGFGFSKGWLVMWL